VIKEEMPDFDIFIDDNNKIITKTREVFPHRIFVLPDYKTNRNMKDDNIYRVKTECSDLTDKDFQIAALEIKLRALEKKFSALQQNSKKASLWKQPSTYLIFASGVVIVLLGLGVYRLIRRKKRKI